MRALPGTLTMTDAYEYQVCQVQEARVTWVNGVWAGDSRLKVHDLAASLESCCRVWTYLDQAGQEGWELVAVVSQSHQDAGSATQTMYLKRCRLQESHIQRR
jgi:hypothetical protein